MDVKKRLVDANARLFKVMEKVKVPVDYHQAEKSSYDVESGTNKVKDNVLPLVVIMKGFEAQQIDGKVIQPFDQKCLIEAADLGDYQPSVADWVMDQKKQRWIIMSATLLGAGTRWTLHLRMP